MTPQEQKLIEVINFCQANALREDARLGVELLDEVKQMLEAATVKTEATKYQLCPKCNGQGRVSKPPHIPEGVDSWSSASFDYECDVCNGKKLILPPPAPAQGVEEAAKEYATGMIGIGEYNEKNWHHNDKMLFQTIVKAVKYGSRWQQGQEKGGSQ